MDVIALSVIITYLVLATAAGSAMARRSKSASGWAVAGGSMSTAMVGFGIAGTRIGSGLASELRAQGDFLSVAACEVRPEARKPVTHVHGP